MNNPQNLTKPSANFTSTMALVRSLPFDMARENYANAVQVGLIERSMLRWAKFERQLDLMEKMILGPLARRV